MLLPRILVVEDFDKFRQFIVSTLHEKTEYLVTQSSDGPEAIQKAQDQKPDLVLLDIGLPSLNGISVAKCLRKLTFPPKIVFVSQESSPEIVREALDLGALGYVQKLRVRTDLLPAIEAALEGKHFVSTRLDGDQEKGTLHGILFCPDEVTLLDGFTRFIGSALNAGNSALVLATELHQGDLLERLHARGVDIDAAIRRGTYISFDADKEPDPVQFLGVIKALSEAAKAGKERPRIAFCGERAGRLWAEGKTDEAIRLEQFCGELVRSYDLDVLCAYPLPHNREDDGFKSICDEHSIVSFR
jgi:CheY-like chemotaxis protein